MKTLITTLLLVAFSTFAIGQSVIGKVVDESTGEPLIGASIMLDGTSNGAVSDYNGTFTIDNVEAGTYKLLISYVGYDDMEQMVDVGANGADLGDINVKGGAILSEVNVIASVAIDRKTPVAVTTIKGAEIEALIGNQEFPEILRNTPSIYVTKTGGGFGDARINVRGFDQRNTAVMINGIPVNDMENGWVYWSNWAGLSDVTSNMQVQRGLGASKLAVPAVGGSINIITNAADLKSGGAASITVGNDNYQKYGLVLSSGLMENGWAVTVQGTKTSGNGYVDGTQFSAYSYFGSVSKTFNPKHTIQLTALGAPQWHHQRTLSRFDNVTIADFREDQLGHKFNPVWGTLDGEEFTFRKNFYHKPKIFMNHYFNINEKVSLKSSVYYSQGRGGGTGPRGRLRTPGSVFDSFSGVSSGVHNASGQVRFDDLVAYNSGTGDFSDWGGLKDPKADGPFMGQNVVQSNGSDTGSGFIRRASMNSHNWTGILSTLTADLGTNLVLTAGIDGRYYKGIHYRRVENLLGADAYLSRSNDNAPANYITEASPADFGNFGDDSYETGNNVLNYWNDGLVSWLGLFAQLEYSLNDLTLFGSVSGSQQGFKRVDYFNYLDNDPQQTSDWVNHMGGTVKGGINYNMNETSNVYVNGGFFSKQPIFDNVFINFVNEVNEEVQNQKVYAVEAGYGFRSNKLRANVNVYNTIWTNRQFDVGVDLVINDSTQHEGLAIFDGVGQRHTGFELDFSYMPVRNLTINGMASLGNWEYTKDFTASVTDLDTNTPAGDLTIFGDGLKVGDAAQTTMSIGVKYEIIDGLRIYGDYYFADNLYANFDIADDRFQDPSTSEVIKVPSYYLVNGGISYNFAFNGIDLTARLNVNNVTDNIYISELFTNNPDDLEANQGWFGFGRTWNAGVKVKF